MKTLRTLAITCVVLLAGLGIVSAQDLARPTNQPAFSQDAIHTAVPVKQIHVMRLRSGPSATGQLSVPFRRRARASHATKPMNSGTITYTCDPSVAAATCNYLNTTIAGDYSSTFTNANANIYITYGTTGLGQSQGYFNLVTYSQYLAALTANTTQTAVQVAALSALNTYDATPYGSDNVNLSAALGTALGFSGMTGTTTGGDPCTLGASGCYNEIITVTNTPGIFYYDNLGGTEPSDEYDFYGVVEHETDEVLGTSSCIDTQDGGVLTDPCDFAGGTGTPSAVDLFRYNSAGDLALNSSYLGLASAPLGAYFSYNGGTTNGANGVANTPKVYNTLANGDDYADFVSSSPDCGTDIAVQDGEGCPGEDTGLTILNDGGGEINILNAVGYDVPAVGTAGFSLSASPNNVAIAQGSSGTSTITITPSNGFSGSVTLSALNLPSGVTATFTPNPATTSSSLSLSASANATTGMASVTIQGTSGDLTNTTPLSLNVTPTSSGQVTVSPASLTFGDLYVGNIEAHLLTLTNTGSTKATIGPISFNVTSGDASQFSFTEFCGATLAPERKCEVKVSFSPDAAGTDGATLNIVAGTSTIQVPIAASGMTRKR